MKNANLNEQVLMENKHSKIIKNAKISTSAIEKAEQKDKFLGMILVEFQ